jgi:hypothetical protein
MQAYKSAISADSTLVLSTDSDFFKFLSNIGPEGRSAVSAPRRLGL